MLNVKTPEEVLNIIDCEFRELPGLRELLPLEQALGRVLAENIYAGEYVPDFDRSTVDGYALRARDTFGCSESIPAMLEQSGEILMGQAAGPELGEGCCRAVPTGGAVPAGADCVAMLEHTQDFGDGLIAVLKPVAPGENMIFRGDDVYPGKLLLKKGRVLTSRDIGALAAIGRPMVPVVKKLSVGVISTGDELVAPGEEPKAGQVRDVNGPMLSALLVAFGVRTVNYGIVPDDENKLRQVLGSALEQCDAVLMSGGSSVGAKDAASRIIEDMGELLLHGIAIKPGKPTILGRIEGKPVVGLPGHPAAAWFVARVFVLPLLAKLMGRQQRSFTVTARLARSVSANHGRAQYQGVRLEKQGEKLIAWPIHSKSGLISDLAGADAYFCIDSDCEGMHEGAEIQLSLGDF